MLATTSGSGPGLFPNHHRLLVELFGLRLLALGLVKLRKVIAALSNVGMIRAQRLFPDRQRTS